MFHVYAAMRVTCFYVILLFILLATRVCGMLAVSAIARACPLPHETNNYCERWSPAVFHGEVVVQPTPSGGLRYTHLYDAIIWFT